MTHHIHRSTAVRFCIVWKLYDNNNTLFNADLQMMLLKMYWLYRLRCVSSATCHPNWVSPPSLHPSLCLSPCTRSTSLPESTALCLGILIELQSSTCYRQSPCFCILLLQIFQFTMNFLHESLIIYDNSGMKYTYQALLPLFQTIDHTCAIQHIIIFFQ